jgi:hypothetical protein
MYTEESLAKMEMEPIVRLAIHEGLQQSQDNQQTEDKVIIKISETEREMLKLLSNALALSSKSVIESAINYLYFYVTHNAEKETDMISTFPNSESESGYCFSLYLDTETWFKLEKLNLQNQVNASVVLGIRLLYQQLTRSRVAM